MIEIRTDRDLDTFRQQWPAQAILQSMQGHGGKILINWAVGMGKSFLLDNLVEEALKGPYDLVLVTCPTRQLLKERRGVQHPLPLFSSLVLKPRPSTDCGELNDAWRDYEKRGLGALGRSTLCKNCPKRPTCFWPNQYGQGLQGIKVIYATQAHLNTNPNFIPQLIAWTEAQRPLLLLDEVNCIMKTTRRNLAHADLKRFHNILIEVHTNYTFISNAWRQHTHLLLVASTQDLRDDGWKLPPMPPDWALAIQEAGQAKFGSKFKFLGYELPLFCASEPLSRQRLPNNDVQFSYRPRIPCDTVVFSGTSSHEFVADRLGFRLYSPFSDYRFIHPETRWYNLASRLGMKCYFLKNAAQILDFYAALMVQRLNQGQRVLLVAKKCFREFCAAEITRRLHAAGWTHLRVVYDQWDEVDLGDPEIIPLITYGTIGTNLFEHFDAAYCLTGYYVNVPIINHILQDIQASNLELPIIIRTEGNPLRRIASVRHAGDQIYDAARLAQSALHQQEMEVVLQAVGRVRPYTRLREIFIFQCAAHPQLEYDREFSNIHEAREFFSLTTARHQAKLQRLKKIQAAQAKGMTQVQVAEACGVSLSSVKRHWKQQRSHKKLLTVGGS